jgi:predicted metalloprotease with PDZ domain
MKGSIPQNVVFGNRGGAARTPFAKDRLGMALRKDGAGVVVKFVSPGSPAAAAGFKAEDHIVAINGKQAAAWSDADLAQLRFEAAATTVIFTLDGGDVRTVSLAEFF